ncbi:hypothetical protein B566_EDAN001111 [Ephemera danica]|nr:hypothetical protein B566_EDAN001111 [Ephemera danica]
MFLVSQSAMPEVTRVWITDEDKYDEKTRLTPELRELARTELREDATIRNQALKTMRDWLKKHPRILNCRLDSDFLLRFLRAKKFSIMQTQESLERYLLLRQSRGLEFSNLDYLRPEVSELFDTGLLSFLRFLFPSPRRDHLGRRVIIVLPGRGDPYRVTKETICRTVGAFGETLLEDEEVQIRGLVYFVDGSGVSLSYLTLCTPLEAVRVVKNGERTVPIRHKDIIGFNVNPAMKYVLDWGMSLISEKIRSRVKLCTDLEEAHQHIDKKLLPKEYGGDIPMVEMMALWREEMAQTRSRILSHDQMKVNLNMYSEAERIGTVSALKHPLGSNCGKASKTPFGVNGSFRKLEVD